MDLTSWDVWQIFNNFLYANTISHWKCISNKPNCVEFVPDRNNKSWRLIRDIDLKTGKVSASLYENKVLRLQFTQQPYAHNPQLRAYEVLEGGEQLLASGKAKVDSDGSLTASESKAIVQLLPPFMKS